MHAKDLADILITAAQLGRSIAPTGLGDAFALLAIGLTMASPLALLTAATLRWCR